jgi:RNA polymerase sigma factor (sigma-70 family)
MGMKITESSELTANWNQFILQGDLNALSRIYFFYYDLLFDYGMKHSSDMQLVEDAIQEVFLNLIKSRKKISEVRNLSGYLISSFRRQLFAVVNRQRKSILSGHISEEQFYYFKSPEQDIPEQEINEQLHLIIEQCVGTLTPRQQEILFLRFKKEITYPEIAEMLNISVDSCYKSVYRTIKMIREEAEKILDKQENMFFLFCLVRHLPRFIHKYRDQPHLQPSDRPEGLI